MRLKRLEVVGFKSFAKKAVLEYTVPISAIVGPNGSGKSNVAEAMRFVLGEQSIKSMRGKKGEDLIFNGTEKVGRLNHAKVTVVFDNSDRAFKIDYDELSIAREVYRDGTHQYYINGSQVRLKDVLELLSSVHIGASSHHIISQGEADRILNSSLKERKNMIEDALGLKIYHWRIDESEKKLKKTEENLKEVSLLRREIAPHLKYLKKQVEKIERAQSLREELVEKYKEYIFREEVYLKDAEKKIVSRKQETTEKLRDIDEKMSQLQQQLSSTERVDPRENDVQKNEEELATLRSKRSELTREIGKLEGMIEYEDRKQREFEEKLKNKEVSVRASMEDVESLLDSIENIVSIDSDSLDDVHQAVHAVRATIKTFRDEHGPENTETGIDEFDENTRTQLQTQLSELQKRIEEMVRTEESLAQSTAALRASIEEDKTHEREAERALYELRAERAHVSTRLETIRSEEARLSRETHNLQEEIQEAVSIIGAQVTSYDQLEIEKQEIVEEERERQESRKREIEKIKIRIEDLGGGSGEDVIREYEEVKERDVFLEKEVSDLTETASSLRGIIEDLNNKLEQEFKSGVEKINEQFQRFFSLMFGGGSASLVLVAEVKKKRSDASEITATSDSTEVQEEEVGIDIKVSLPQKKLRGLHMLSGGERALTSIALLFAVSQVNPPPFMILDETDAALDEANSRKYGDMLESLSEYSQLIVITHNRETMSRAGVLYGVTMDSGATSTLLSVKFEEATEIAR